MKTLFGTCVENPFGSVDRLVDIIDEAEEITKRQFLNKCEVDESEKEDMKRFPNDYAFLRNEEIYFFVHSCVEHFFK